MRLVSRISAEGFYLEDVFLADGAPLPASHVESRPPQGFYRPRWNGTSGAWVEGKPASEILTEAKANKEAELRDAADNWYRTSVRAFEGQIVGSKWAKGQALLPEEQAVFNEMSAAYTRLKNLIGQVRAATTLEGVQAVTWT